MDKVREAIYQILLKCIYKGAYSNLALQALSREDFTRRDRAFATEAVYGAVSKKRALEHIIGQHSSVPIKKMSSQVHVLLILGAYQIIYMSKVPDSAACNTTVELAKVHSKKSVGFINAVLRAIARGREAIVWPDSNVDWLPAQAIKFSYPDWMVEAWLEAFGKDKTLALLEAGNTHPLFSIRANSLKNNRVELAEILGRAGIEVKLGSIAADALILESPDNFTQLEAFREGRFTVQDSSAMVVTEYLDPQPGEEILDLCCAPGGKTTHIGERMKNTGRLTGWDVHLGKLGIVRENVKRLGLENIHLECKDSTLFVKEAVEKYDRVLVDAPCSGTGIIRRKPDIKWHRKQGDIAALVEIQNMMLYNAGRYVKIGGVLVYSTCSMERDENEYVCNRFLAQSEASGIVFIVEKDMPYKHFHPDNPETDGFFIARFRRV